MMPTTPTPLASRRDAQRATPQAPWPGRTLVRGMAWMLAALVGSTPVCLSARPDADRAHGTLRFTSAGRHLAVRVALARADVDAASDHVVTSLGTRGRFLLLLDSYASRPQPLSRCGAGHENWVRLIDLRAASERWSRRVESCRNDLSAGTPAATWAKTGTAFTVHPLAGPDLSLNVDPDGRVTPAGEVSGAASAHPAWLVGTWDVQDPSAASRVGACLSGTDQVAYSPGGYWIGLAVGDYGRWRVSGRTLVETQLEAGAGEPPAPLHSSSSRVEQLAPGRVRLRRGNETMLMVRCGLDADRAFPKGLRH